MNKSDQLILGITSIDGYTHDNSIAILKNGKILFAASEERFSRVKHDSSFPVKALNEALKYLKLKPSSITTIAIGYPKRRVVSILAHRYFYEIILFMLYLLIYRNFLIFKDLINFIRLTYQKYNQNKELAAIKASRFFNNITQNKEVRYFDHHLSHASSAYYTSGYNNCITVVLDAFGSSLSGKIRSGAVFLCQNGQMEEVMSIPFFASLGLFYTAVTHSLGFPPGDGEGKTMGLAAYGNPKRTYTFLRSYSPTFSRGSWWAGKDWLSGLLTTIPALKYLFVATRFGHMLSYLVCELGREDVAAAAQQILEIEVVKLIKYLIQKFPENENFCLAGGVFLNVKLNKKILEISRVNNIFVHPNAGDGGLALGAAFVATSQEALCKRIGQPLINCDLGQSFTNAQVLKVLNQYRNKIRYKKLRSRNYVSTYTATQLQQGKVIGWFQGRAEWGPRALGFRSVLADPRDIRIKEYINSVLKNREWFMPFAPSVLEERQNQYFRNARYSPFMTVAFDIIDRKKANSFPAAIHIDNTARPNTVNNKNNPLYYQLIQAFYRKTGLPILLNTSFNKHGLPIVNSPKDAIEHLLMGTIDKLIIGSYFVERSL